MRKDFTLLVLMLFTTVFSSLAIKPEEPSELKATVVKNPDGGYAVQLSVKAPTKEYSYDNPADLEFIDKVTITRSCYDLSESYLPVVEFDDPKPGETLLFEDKNVKAGYSYTYYATATIEDQTSYSASVYGVFIGIKPATPSLSLTIGDDGMPPVKVAVTAPSKSDKGADLEGVMTLKVTRTIGYSGSPVVKEFENVMPGESVSYDDTMEKLSETYYYKVVAITADGTSDDQSKSIYVGRDLPGAPAKVTASLNDKGGVDIVWEAPAAGANGGAFLTPVLYKVVRLNDGAVISEGKEACSATDDCSTMKAPASITYAVTAYNADGTASKATANSNSVVAGPAASLPFYDGFNGAGYYGGPEQLWSYDEYEWDFSKYSDYNTGLQPYKGAYDDGMAYAYYSYSSTPGAEYEMTTCALNLGKAVNPVATIYYFPTDCDNALRFEGVSGPDKAVLLTLPIAQGYDASFKIDENDPASGWVKAYIPMQSLAGKESVNFRIVSVGAMDTDRNSKICVDEFEIDDYPYASPSANVNNDESSVKLTWSDPSTETRKADAYTIFVDGEAVAKTEECEYLYQAKPETTYTMHVAAHYGDYMATAPESAFLTVNVGSASGVENVAVNGEEINVEYFNMQGVKVNAPAPGEMLIRRATLQDGTIRAAKVVVR